MGVSTTSKKIKKRQSPPTPSTPPKPCPTLPATAPPSLSPCKYFHPSKTKLIRTNTPI
jgi:hypothetical protein